MTLKSVPFLLLIPLTLMFQALGCAGSNRNPSAPPNLAPASIQTLTATPLVLIQGQTATLNVTFSGGSGSLDQGIGPVVSGTPVNVAPSATTTYTLRVQNQNKAAVTESITLTVLLGPSISSFSTAVPSIALGYSTVLTAVFSGGTGAIDQGIGPITSGIPFKVTPTVTTEYTLTVTNTGGQKATQVLTVTVGPGPVITSFAASDTAILEGQTTILTADFSGGTGAINSGVGPITSGIPASVAPTSSTTYLLTVTDGSGNSCTRSVTITVAPPPDFMAYAAPDRIPITIGGQGALQIGLYRAAGESGPILLTLQNGPVGIIAGGDIPATSIGGSIEVKVAPDLPPGTYPLTFRASDGTHTHPVEAWVVATTPEAPAIDSFVATPLVLTTGESLTLTGTYTNGIGSVGGLATESGVPFTLLPLFNSVYTLSVVNGDGLTTTAASPEVVVNQPDGLGLFIASGLMPVLTGMDTTSVLVTGPGAFEQTCYFGSFGVAGIPPGMPPGKTFLTSTLGGLGTGTYVLTWSPAVYEPNAWVGKSGTPPTFTYQPKISVQTVDLSQGTLWVGNAFPAPPCVTASQSPIAAGQSTTLTAWLPTGASGTIDQGIGEVTNGTPVTISPVTTTTYTLTVALTNQTTITDTVTINVK